MRSDSEWYDSIWGCSKPPRRVRRCRRRRVCHEQSKSGSVNVTLQEEQNQFLKNIESALERISEVAIEFMRVTRCTKSRPFEGNGVQSSDENIKNFDDCSRDKAGHEPNHGMMESKDHLCRVMQPVSGDYCQEGNKWTQFCKINKKKGETLCDYARRLETVSKNEFPGEEGIENILCQRFLQGVLEDERERIKSWIEILRSDKNHYGETEWKLLLKALMEDDPIVAPHNEIDQEEQRKFLVQPCAILDAGSCGNPKEERSINVQ